MELRVLKYFLAVAREGSITGAANSLHLTQPTLTRQLQDLEKELKQNFGSGTIQCYPYSGGNDFKKKSRRNC